MENATPPTPKGRVSVAKITMNLGLRVMGITRHRSSGGAAIVQSKYGGSGSGTTSATTSAAGFASNTVSGNYLICLVYANASASGSGTVAIHTPLTSGFTWTLVKGATYTGTNRASVSMYAIPNAGAMLTSNTTTVGATGTLATTTKVEFALYEVSGLTVAGTVDASASNTGSSSAMSTANLSTSFKDFIFAGGAAASGTASTGSGYSAGVPGSAVDGASQYKLNQSSGSIATAFGGTNTDWACIAVALEEL